MKHRISQVSIIVIFLMLFSSVSAGVLKSLQFSDKEIKWTEIQGADGVEYVLPEIDGLRMTSEIGKPSLPVKYIRLLIPVDKDVESIEFVDVNEKKLPGSYLIYPAQPPIPLSDRYTEPDFVKPDVAVYGSDKPFPVQRVEVVHDGYFDGSNHIVTIAIYPLQYLPSKREVIFAESIEFKLKLTKSKMVPLKVKIRKEKSQRIYNKILRNLIDNPEDIPVYQNVPPEGRGLGKPSSIQSGPLPAYEYVIITRDSIKDAFEPFLEWKKRKGLDIGVVTVEEILSTYSGDLISGIYDDAGKIRQYLSDAYLDGTIWVLLAGDHTIVPTRYGNHSNDHTDIYNIIPSDLYFADFNGDWDVDGVEPNGKNLYGEKNDDDVDYNPEIFVGRVPCTNRKDIENWIEKVLNYEMDPGNGDYVYLLNQYWIQGGDIYSNPDYVKDHYPSTFTHTIWYNTTIHEATDVVNEMSKNYGIINLYTHGAPNSIRIKPDSYTENNRIYTTDDGTTWGDPSEVAGDGLDGLKNYFHYSVVYSISCDVAAWDDIDISRCPGRSFGEGFTVMYKHTGCVAFLGNTRAGYMSGSPQYGPSMDLHKIFCDLLSNGSIDPESGKSYLHIGVAEAVSKLNYTGSEYHHLRLTHNLLGCPEMEIWTDIPSQFTNVSITDNGNSITVNAGVSGATICVSSGDNGASYHLVADNVSQYTFTTSVRPLYITITKHNYIPYTAVTGGTFTSNEYWFGNMHILGDVVVGSGKTLTTLPYAAVNLNGHAIRSTGGTVIVESGAGIGPEVRLMCGVSVAFRGNLKKA